MTTRYPLVPDYLNCEIIGYLYTADDPSDLGQTMAEIVTPNDELISCGWIPEGNPNGSYCVMVTQGLSRLLPDFKTRDIEAAAQWMERVARSLCLGIPITSAPSETVTTTVTNFTFSFSLPSVEIEDRSGELVSSCV